MSGSVGIRGTSPGWRLGVSNFSNSAGSADSTYNVRKMKLNYTIRFEDFRALQPHLPGRAGRNAGFKMLVGVGVIFLALGIWCLVEGFGTQVGVFNIALAILGVSAGYLFDRRSIRSSKEKREKNIAVVYDKIHCRESRNFEADEGGFKFSCNCGAILRPWSELIQFSENESHFLLTTRKERQLIPKSAFGSEGEVTEFRALVQSHLGIQSHAVLPRIEFRYTREDHRSAFLLNAFQGGGWRLWLKKFVPPIALLYVAIRLWSEVGPEIGSGLVGGSICLFGLMIFKSRTKKYFGPMRISFSKDCLYFEAAANSGRINWNEFVGYLENKKVLLLYHNARAYRLIPKRSLTAGNGEFCGLVHSTLSEYDYKSPFRSSKVPELQQSR